MPHAFITASPLFLHIQSDEALRSYGFGLDIILEAREKGMGSTTAGAIMKLTVEGSSWQPRKDSSKGRWFSSSSFLFLN